MACEKNIICIILLAPPYEKQLSEAPPGENTAINAHDRLRLRASRCPRNNEELRGALRRVSTSWEEAACWSRQLRLQRDVRRTSGELGKFYF